MTVSFRPRNLVKLLALAPIRFYQRYISPAFPRRCRYYPTCSSYAVQAIDRHGVGKGFLLAIWRILRCNPYSTGGIDEVPETGRWVSDPPPTYAELVAKHSRQSSAASAS